MSQADVELARPDHPWLGEFERDPETAFDRIVRGIALIPPYGRADALTVIPSLFDPLDPSDPLLSALDRAARLWIEHWRCRLPEERVDYGFKRYVRDAVTALRLPQLLALTETRAMLRDDYFQYLRWAEPLVLGTSLDPRAAFWLALAEEQPDLRFESLWQRLCRQTGEGLYPAHYLSIGFLGLRRLQVEENERLQRVLGGLAAWAANLPDNTSAKRTFLQQVRMLRWLFPLPSRAGWRYFVEPIVQAHGDEPFVEWWQEELGPTRRPVKPSTSVREPDRSEVNQLLRDISQEGIDAHRRQIELIIRKREAFAQATGDSHHLILTVIRIARDCLVEAPELALDLTRRALVWETSNPRLWNLWGRSLATSGSAALAEAVFWEALRRFPDDELFQVELGCLIGGLGRIDEALAVLRGAARRFPQNERAHTELGRLLRGAGRTDEALAVFREATRRFPDHEHSHVELARLLAAAGDFTSATALLRRYTARHPNSPISLNMFGLLLVDVGHVEEARMVLTQLEELGAERAIAELGNAIARAEAGESILVPDYQYPTLPSFFGSADDYQENVYRELLLDSTVTCADFELGPEVRPQLPQGRQRQLLENLEAVMNENPNHGYARVVWFERARVSDEARRGILGQFPDLFELRLVAALIWNDAAMLKTLDEKHPEQAPLLRFSRMVIRASDVENGKRALRWLQREAPPADDLVGAYLHRAVREQLTKLGIEPAKAEPDMLVEHAGSLRQIVQQAVRMIGALPVAA